MPSQNDPTLSAITLVGLPSLDDIRMRIDPRTWETLKPVLQRMPLLNLLNEILNLATPSEETEKRALLDLARLAIAKHEHTRHLYSDIIGAVTSSSGNETDLLLKNLPKEDGPLTLEILS